MAGRIRDEDVAAVRDKIRIDEVIREYVALKSAGGGSLKGLCPFHDERTPSFNVNAGKGYWFCFGCNEGGDAIGFLRKIDGMSFAEAVEKLAGKVGVSLRYEEGGAGVGRETGRRTRLVEAHRAAAAFYVECLATPEALTGRDFLTGRGFDASTWPTFGIGYAPKGWDALTNHLRGKGFTDRDLLEGGLVSQGTRGVYDRFRGRLVWPIRELGGDVIGFGARKLYDDDQGPKYLNTPETPLYKKSQVLYGIDLARKEISKQQSVVIVEGYTDVMACHLSGVATAVATCGTAFGGEHVKVLRRLLMDDGVFSGEVIFTFDGDAAGRKAALRAFDDDQKFVAQTFVAIEPRGLDPCDLRQLHGGEAVSALVAARQPLFAFAIRSTLSDFNLDTAEGRVGALRAAAPLVAGIKDTALRPEYVRSLSGWLGVEVDEVRRAVESALRQGGRQAAAAAPARRPAIDLRDPLIALERNVLAATMQAPRMVGAWFASLEPDCFTHPLHRELHAAMVAAGGTASGLDGRAWVEAVSENCPDAVSRTLVTELITVPLPVAELDERYASGVVARLLEVAATRRIAELKGRLTRLAGADPVAEQQALADLMALETYRRSLHAAAHGEQD